MSSYIPENFDASRFILSSIGTINYEPSRPSEKFSNEKICVIDTDEELSAFYRWMWTKEHPSKPLLKPSWEAHISIMRGQRILNDDIPWKYRNGQIITFKYSPEIKHDGEHIWIDTFCEEFFELRQHYNVPIRFNTGHITIGKFRS